MEVTSTLQSVFTQIIDDHQQMDGVTLVEFRLGFDLYKLFLEELNRDLGGSLISEVGEYKGVNIAVIAAQGVFQNVMVLQSKMNKSKK
jgi:hypothetical protein